MPTWGQILKELESTRPAANKAPDFDGVRRKYLAALNNLTKRAVILYSTSYLEQRPTDPDDLINLQDISALMEAVSNIEEKELDLILHSPGGSAEAAESIVTYLRKRFDHIRIFIPVAAMSAATMIALSANEIVMGQHSQLGPIDPQFVIHTPEGLRSAPARAILKQFELAKAECKDASNLAAWMPILRGYMPGLLTQCHDAQALATKMVSTWLKQYMFDGESDAEAKADSIASWFADYDSFHSHGRGVSPDEAIRRGLKVTWLENAPALQDAVLTVHHATMHTFAGTGAVKIVENHHGRAWVRIKKSVLLPAPIPVKQKEAINPTEQQPLNRAERRRQQHGRR